MPRARRATNSGRSRLPRRRGVSVEEREYGFVARYTTPDGKRPSLPASATWLEAFNAACGEMDKIERARFRDPRATRMTFAELVRDHYLPTYAHAAGNTVKNIHSHLGGSTGQAARKGGKNQRAARFQLLPVFGDLELASIGPQDVRAWQAGLVREGFAHPTIKAKRTALRGILEIARVNGWIDLNPVDAVPEPPKRQRSDDDRVIVPDEWVRIRAQLSGRTTLLFCDVALDAGLRYEDVTGLRPIDLVDATLLDPQHFWIRQVIAWPGKRFTADGRPFELKEPKGRRWRKVAVSRHLFRSLLDYIEENSVAPEALIFDFGRIRAEHSFRRKRDPLPESPPSGRYVSSKSGRSGAHGRYTTYALGCRCPFCRNAYTEYRFWWARSRGRRAAQPWLEDGFIASRHDAVDPVEYHWFHRTIWTPAVNDAGLDWKPTFHDLRHAMVSWSLEAGAALRTVQLDAGHASIRTTEVYVHRLNSRVPSERLAAMEQIYKRMDTSGDDGSAGRNVKLESPTAGTDRRDTA
jgi:integrase